MVEGKYCPNCYTFKHLDEFSKKMRNGVDIKQSYCIPCKRLLDRQYKRAIRSYKPKIRSNHSISPLQIS